MQIRDSRKQARKKKPTLMTARNKKKKKDSFCFSKYKNRQRVLLRTFVIHVSALFSRFLLLKYFTKIIIIIKK